MLTVPLVQLQSNGQIEEILRSNDFLLICGLHNFQQNVSVSVGFSSFLLTVMICFSRSNDFIELIIISVG